MQGCNDVLAVNRDGVVALIDGENTDIVMGMHWDPAGEHGLSTGAANLDALCLLFDANGALIERIDPRRLRSSNGSVMHTGDSVTGASVWDDERIFVFLPALSEVVHTLAFGVISVSGHALCDVAGASCHLSDHRMERELIQVDLTQCGHVTYHCPATLSRTSAGWMLRRDVPHNNPGWAALRSL